MTTAEPDIPAQHRRARARHRVRLVRAEYGRVAQAIADWSKRRQQLDPLQMYRTQLQFLDRSLQEALGRLESELAAMLKVSSATPGEIYARCRTQELRLAWIERLWLYFRRKFDQRDDPAFAPTLLAADEMVWSCYKPAFVHAQLSVPPAPLSYIEPLASPNASPRDQRPGELENNVDDEFLRACLETLPIPVLGLTPACVAEPWWLIFVAHEVGHHVQHELKVVRSFGDALKAAAGDTWAKQGLPTVASSRWWVRGQEVFADVYSLLIAGPPAVDALAELLHDHPDRAWLTADDRYPPAQVRLALLAEAARQLGLAAPDYGHTPPPAGAGAFARAAANDLAAIPALAAAALSWETDGTSPLVDLTGWRDGETLHSPLFSPGGTTDDWTAALITKQDPPALPELGSPRVLVAAAVKTWAQIITDAATESSLESADTSAPQLSDLKERLLRLLPAMREAGTRAAKSGAAAAPEGLSAVLFAAPTEQLEPSPGRAGVEVSP